MRLVMSSGRLPSIPAASASVSCRCFSAAAGPVSTANFLPVGCIGPLIRGEALRAGRLGELILGTDAVLRRRRTVAARLAFAPGFSLSQEDLAIPKYEAFEWENFVIPAAKSVDDIWKSMSTGRRQAGRQAEKRGVVVTNSLPEEITEWFPGEMSSLYEREGRILASGVRHGRGAQ